MARMLSSTAAVALSAASVAGSAHATVINALGGLSPQDPTAIGTITVGDEITFSQTLPAYWEFTWSGAPAADIAAHGTFVGSFFGSPYGNLKLYQASGTPPTVTATLTISHPFGVTGFEPIIGSFGTGFVAADLGSVPLMAGDEYVVGISSAGSTDPSGAIDFNDAPEPASLTLLGSALAFFGLRRRRRKTTA